VKGHALRCLGADTRQSAQGVDELCQAGGVFHEVRSAHTERAVAARGMPSKSTILS
jgi:hypothetical protein